MQQYLIEISELFGNSLYRGDQFRNRGGHKKMARRKAQKFPDKVENCREKGDTTATRNPW